MDPRKFEYLETLREKLEDRDYEDLQEYMDSIREQVKADPHFMEVFEEINSRKYGDALSLIDEVIFEDMQSEFEEFYQEGELSAHAGMEDDEIGLGEDLQDRDTEGITFEEFNEDNYYGGQGSDDDY
jgi:hypothetical protein